MSKILSVVIPSYNVERYLEQTLDSFIETSIMDLVEVIVVDDGSKDRTAEIGQKYAEKFPNTFRVISKPNGGHGSTINKGIEVAAGKYFKVVDGDDWVNTADFAKLVKELETCNADYVVNDYFEVNDSTKEKTPVTFGILGQKEVWDFVEITDKVQLPMHSLVIRTDILQNNQIRIDENRFYVDVEYILFPIPYVRTVKYIPLCVYEYRVAVTTQSVSMQGFQKHMQNHIDVILHMLDFLKAYTEQGGETKKIQYIAERIATMVGDQAGIFTSFPATDEKIKKQFQEFDQQVKAKSELVYTLSDRKSRVLHMLRKFDFKGYRVLAQISNIHNRR